MKNKQGNVINLNSVTIGTKRVFNQENPKYNPIVDIIEYKYGKVNALRKEARITSKRIGVRADNDQYASLSKEKSIDALIDLVVELKNNDNTLIDIAEVLDCSEDHVGLIYSGRHLPKDIRKSLNIHSKIPNKDSSMEDKLNGRRYLSLSHIRALRIGQKELTSIEFEKKFYPLYKKNLPSSTQSSPAARKLVTVIKSERA